MQYLRFLTHVGLYHKHIERFAVKGMFARISSFAVKFFDWSSRNTKPSTGEETVSLITNCNAASRQIAVLMVFLS